MNRKIIMLFLFLLTLSTYGISQSGIGIVIGDGEVISYHDDDGDLISMNSEGGTLHYITASSTMDLREKSIGTSATVSHKMMLGFVRQIVELAGMELRVHEVSGRSFSRANLERAINGVSCSEKDVIFTNIICHGYRYNDTRDQFGYVLLQQKSERVGLAETVASSLHLQDIHQQLLKKGARFTLTMAEACNNFTGINTPNGVVGHDIVGLSAEGVAKLIGQSHGNYLVSSSKPGQLSWSHDESGGFFTNGFLNAFRDISKQGSSANWDSVFKLSITNTEKISQTFLRGNPKGNIQTPQYMGNISNRNDRRLATRRPKQKIDTEDSSILIIGY